VVTKNNAYVVVFTKQVHDYNQKHKIAKVLIVSSALNKTTYDWKRCEMVMFSMGSNVTGWIESMTKLNCNRGTLRGKSRCYSSRHICFTT